MTATKEITAGQVLTARSLCDYDCVFTAYVLDRKGATITVKCQGNISRVKVKVDSDGVEYCYAMGRCSMAPIFRAN